jgi:hypothetical protein
MQCALIPSLRFDTLKWSSVERPHRTRLSDVECLFSFLARGVCHESILLFESEVGIPILIESFGDRLGESPYVGIERCSRPATIGHRSANEYTATGIVDSGIPRNSRRSRYRLGEPEVVWQPTGAISG